MHGQQTVSGVGRPASPERGKVLPDGNMPPHADSSSQHPQSLPSASLSSSSSSSLLAERMSSSSRQYALDAAAAASAASRGSNGSVGDGIQDSGGDFYGMDAAAFELKKKKQQASGLMAGKGLEEELCRICGDRASGYHYNALSCEGCKGFFRRSITKTAQYVCKYGGNCEMDMWMRRKCQACRLRRCREVGMKEECLLSEYQCQLRLERRKKQKTSPSSFKKETDVASPDSNEVESDIKPPAGLPTSSSSSSLSPPSSSAENPFLRMSVEQQEVVRTLVMLQEKFEFPDEQDVKEATEDISSEKAARHEVTADGFLNAMAQMTVLITHLIVEFAKCLPGFTDLDKDDQIILLKSASSEVMAIRAARCYDVDTKSIVFANGQPCTLDNMLATGLGKYAKLVYEFCHNMTVTMQTDNAEYALITAICIFSERPGLKDKERVEELQSTYVNTLYSYEKAKRPRGGTALGLFLTRLSDLRSISLEHSSLLLDLQNVGSTLPTIMKEVYILPPEGS